MFNFSPICPKSGWDGTTALGGAVVDSQPARYLADIRAAGGKFYWC